MKIPSSQKWAAVCVSILAMTAALKSSADQTATAIKPDETCTGTISTVDPKERVMEVRGFVKNKKFNLSDTCTYLIVGKDTGSIGDLHPGQRVTVSYQNANGVLVADRVKRGMNICDGLVITNDTARHSLMLCLTTQNKVLQIADDCQIMLYDGKSGAVTDIQPGNHLTVAYEKRDGKDVAREIAQTGITFTGRVTALDQADRTAEAKWLLNLKKFHLADNCAIVENGKTEAQLSNLKLGDKLTFNYNNINGVNIVNRIDGANIVNRIDGTNIVNHITNAPPTHATVMRSPRMQKINGVNIVNHIDDTNIVEHITNAPPTHATVIKSPRMQEMP